MPRIKKLKAGDTPVAAADAESDPSSPSEQHQLNPQMAALLKTLLGQVDKQANKLMATSRGKLGLKQETPRRGGRPIPRAEQPLGDQALGIDPAVAAARNRQLQMRTALGGSSDEDAFANSPPQHRGKLATTTSCRSRTGNRSADINAASLTMG